MDELGFLGIFFRRALEAAFCMVLNTLPARAKETNGHVIVKQESHLSTRTKRELKCFPGTSTIEVIDNSIRVKAELILLREYNPPRDRR